MTKQEILDYFSLIDYAYNESGRYDSLSRMLDELLKEQEGTIKELQNAYGYLQKQFFEAQDKLLKEQEAVKPVRDELTGRIWLCGKCGSYVGFEDNDPYDPNEFDKYCHDCGTPVLWEGLSGNE